jgi:hypothetical protein
MVAPLEAAPPLCVGTNRRPPTNLAPGKGAAASASTPVERIYFASDAALSRNDADALLALYARDAHFESPLVPHLLGTQGGILRGHDELRPLFEKLAERKPPVRQYDRTGYLSDGKRLIWEYPRDAGKGEQMDLRLRARRKRTSTWSRRACPTQWLEGGPRFIASRH